jgi:hypothetical protein
MMKKLLVLLLVLGIVSSAHALFELSVDGQPAPDVILLNPSDWIELDIHIAPGIQFNGGNLEIVLSNNQGILDWSGANFYDATLSYPAFGIWVLEDDAGPAYTVVETLSDPYHLVMTGGMGLEKNAENNADAWAGAPPFFPAVDALSFPVLMDGLLFHCEEATDVEILLVAGGQGITVLEYDANGAVIGQNLIYQPGEIIDGIYVVQPEPMTVALLGLGGLFLRRRK